jgi:hypothetical protein
MNSVVAGPFIEKSVGSICVGDWPMATPSSSRHRLGRGHFPVVDHAKAPATTFGPFRKASS